MKLKTPIKDKARFNKMPLSLLRNQNGVTAVLVAIVLAMLLGFTALAVDVGYMYSTRNELQNVADAAALAGAGELGRRYLEFVVPSDQETLTVAECGARIRTAVKEAAVLNQAAGESIIIRDEDIFIGTWDWNETNLSEALDYETTPNPPDAVRVIARRDETMDTSVATFFAKILSIFGGSADTFQVSAVATAALSGAGTVAEGVLEAPFAISEKTISNCTDVITFSPTTTSCAGWHNFFNDDAYVANSGSSGFPPRMKATIEGFEGDGGTVGGGEGHDWLIKHFDIGEQASVITGEATVGNIFDFSGGVNADLFTGSYYPVWDDKDTPSNPEHNYETDPYPDRKDIFEGPNLKGPSPFITLFDFFRFRDMGGDKKDEDKLHNPVDEEMVTLCRNFPEITPTTVPGSYTTSDGVTRVPANTVWTTTVPIYKEESEGDGCTNPTGDIEIIGFAKVHIVTPNPPPDNTVNVCLDCYDTIEDGRGGGAGGNIIGSIPNLVQ